MSLTGGVFVVLVALLLIAATLAAIVVHPRRGPLGVRLLQRALLVLLVQLLAVGLTAVVVNDWGSFYGSWSDLFGGSTSLVTTQAGGQHQLDESTSGPSDGASALTPTDWSSRAEFATRGEVGSVAIAGPRSGLRSTALMYLPPQYFQVKYAHTTFPVVEVFSGYPGDVTQLVRNLGYPASLLAGIRNGSARPMILAFFNPALAPPRDTECTNVPRGPQVATYFTQDVPVVLQKHLRVTSSGWGAMGHSTGGYCAIKLAMLAPQRFNTVVSLSGYFHAQRDETTGDLWGGSQQVRDLNDPEWRLVHLPVPRISLLASIGSLEGGPEGLRDTQRFMALVRPPMDAKLMVVQDGGHNFRDYQSVLPTAFAWLATHVHG